MSFWSNIFSAACCLASGGSSSAKSVEHQPCLDPADDEEIRALREEIRRSKAHRLSFQQELRKKNVEIANLRNDIAELRHEVLTAQLMNQNQARFTTRQEELRAYRMNAGLEETADTWHSNDRGQQRANSEQSEGSSSPPASSKDAPPVSKSRNRSKGEGGGHASKQQVAAVDLSLHAGLEHLAHDDLIKGAAGEPRAMSMRMPDTVMYADSGSMRNADVLSMSATPLSGWLEAYDASGQAASSVDGWKEPRRSKHSKRRSVSDWYEDAEACRQQESHWEPVTVHRSEWHRG